MISLSKMVAMLVICWVPQGDTLREAWRTNRVTTLAVCLQMQEAFAQGGKFGVITVRCGTPGDHLIEDSESR